MSTNGAVPDGRETMNAIDADDIVDTLRTSLLVYGRSPP